MGGRTEWLWATAAAVASRPSLALVQERRRARFGFVWHEDNGEDNSFGFVWHEDNGEDNSFGFVATKIMRR